MNESSSPDAGDLPAEANTGAAAKAGSETPASLNLARVGSLRVGDPLASTASEGVAPTFKETN